MGSLLPRSIALLPLLLACGCSPGLLPELDRVLRDPTISPPLVRSLDQELRIEVRWESDEAAEQYILERAEDSLLPGYSEVYRGGATFFLDADCRDQGRYLFRLSKTRGSRLFGPSRPVLGAASQTCRDLLEPNDSEEQATVLGDYLRQANLFYFRATPSPSYPGQVLQDADWYSVQVPSQWTAHILITQAGLPTGSEYTHLYLYQKAAAPIHVTNNQLIALDNPSPEPRRLLFKLYLDPSDFILEPTLGGGLLVEYAVSLHSLAGQQP
jgi:hypothetical protein